MVDFASTSNNSNDPASDLESVGSTSLDREQLVKVGAKPFRELSTKEEVQQLSPEQFRELSKIVADVVRRSLFTSDEDVVCEIVGNVYMRLSRWFDATKAPEGKIVPITAKWARQECVLYLDKDDPTVELSENLSTPDRTADDLILTEEHLDRLREIAKYIRAMELLDPKKREILTMALDGVPYSEIGSKVGMETSHVRVAVFRARRALKALINKSKAESSEELPDPSEIETDQQKE